MKESRITQIATPDCSPRVPTGAVQFGEDWPGLFIRGDDAIGVMLSIRELTTHVARADDVIDRFALDLLRRIADMIENDVVVSRSKTKMADELTQ